MAKRNGVEREQEGGRKGRIGGGGGDGEGRVGKEKPVEFIEANKKNNWILFTYQTMKINSGKDEKITGKKKLWDSNVKIFFYIHICACIYIYIYFIYIYKHTSRLTQTNIHKHIENLTGWKISRIVF